MDLLAVLVILSRCWKRLVGGAVALSVAAFLLLLLVPSQYTARATFVPSGTTKGLSALGALGGLPASLSMLGAVESGPKFYADLATSDVILLQVLDTTSRSPARGPGVTSFNYIRANHITARDSLRLRDAALRHLRRHIDVDFDPRTSVVTLQVTARQRDLAVAIARTVLGALNDFNVRTFQTTAGAQRRFLEQRVEQARVELTVAEDSLRTFYTRNRTYQQSPLLVLREAQLRRDYELKQQNLVTLITNLEQARIDEVRDTPVLTILDPPILPAKKSGPMRGLLAIGVGMLWLGGGVLLVSVRTALSQLASHRPEEVAVLRQEFQALRRYVPLSRRKG
jgi:uncharacterized protein involved in exopolysaccharide biosynthesis